MTAPPILRPLVWWLEERSDRSVLGGASYLGIDPMHSGVPNHHFGLFSLWDAPNDVMFQIECRRREA